MTDAERSKRYRIRREARALALMGGGTEIPLAWFGTNAEGFHVAIDEKGNRIELLVKPEPVVLSKRRAGVYPPKGMPRKLYEDVVAKIRERGLTKAQAIAQLGNSENQEIGRRMIALVERLPEGPDWADNFPAHEGE